MANTDFHTFRGYMQKGGEFLTPSMEDYVEMIYRLSRDKNFARVNELAKCLNVQPPSATKMIQKLAELDLIRYEKYGVIILTDEGNKVGKMLLERHRTIEKFLEFIAPAKDVLKQTEMLEHSFNEETLESISIFMQFLKDNPTIIDQFHEYYKKQKGL